MHQGVSPAGNPLVDNVGHPIRVDGIHKLAIHSLFCPPSSGRGSRGITPGGRRDVGGSRVATIIQHPQRRIPWRLPRLGTATSCPLPRS